MNHLVERFEFETYRRKRLDVSPVGEKIREMKEKYPEAEFWAEGSHMNSNQHIRLPIYGQLICWDRAAHFLIHSNPWQAQASLSSYYGGLDGSVDGDEFFISKEKLKSIDTSNREYLWIETTDIQYLEVRYAATNNKEAASLLIRLEE